MKNVPKVTNHLDLQKKQLKNAAIDNLTTAPSNPVEGQVYFNTSMGIKSLYIWDGTVWDKLNDQTMSASDINTALGTITTGEIDFNTTLNMNSKAIIGVTMPTGGNVADNDVANRKFVTDSVANAIQGLDVKQSVACIVTAVSGPPFLYSSSNGGTITYANTPSDSASLTTFDGVTIAVNDRIMVNLPSQDSKNGFYTVHQATPTIELRRTDFLDGSTAPQNAFAFVEQGTTYADTGWVLSYAIPAPIVGSGPIQFTQFSSAGVILAGTGLTKSGNTLSVDTTTIQAKLTASTGISISSNTISLDTANGYGVRKYAANIGDGSATAITVTHGLNTEDVTVQVREASGTKEFVLADVAVSGMNTVTITFDTAPTSNQYRVVVTG